MIDTKDYKKISELEETLNSIDLISDFYILKFNSQKTQYKIIYNGSPKAFFNDMQNRNFKLVMKNNIWTINWKA